VQPLQGTGEVTRKESFQSSRKIVSKTFSQECRKKKNTVKKVNALQGKTNTKSELQKSQAPGDTLLQRKRRGVFWGFSCTVTEKHRA